MHRNLIWQHSDDGRGKKPAQFLPSFLNCANNFHELETLNIWHLTYGCYTQLISVHEFGVFGCYRSKLVWSKRYHTFIKIVHNMRTFALLIVHANYSAHLKYWTPPDLHIKPRVKIFIPDGGEWWEPNLSLCQVF